MKKKLDVKKNSFLIRVQNDDILTYFNDLNDSGIFTSQNEILNRALEIGVPELYESTFGKKVRGSRAAAAPLSENTSKELTEIRLTVDELFVMTNILESLMATLFNVKLSEIEGNAVSADMINSGIMYDLPENLADVKNEMIKRHLRRK